MHTHIRANTHTHTHTHTYFRTHAPTHTSPSLVMLIGVSLPLLAVHQSTQAVGWLDWLAATGALLGLLVAYIADSQLRTFMLANEQRRRDGTPVVQLLNTGIWYYSRHPNYFGEQLWWWSFGLLAVSVGQVCVPRCAHVCVCGSGGGLIRVRVHVEVRVRCSHVCVCVCTCVYIPRVRRRVYAATCLTSVYDALLIYPFILSVWPAVDAVWCLPQLGGVGSHHTTHREQDAVPQRTCSPLRGVLSAHLRVDPIAQVCVTKGSHGQLACLQPKRTKITYTDTQTHRPHEHQ
jgi:protein-S-isoprenylcysteine O-methyltransferase Ste14